jgi:hypothetical protein
MQLHILRAILKVIISTKICHNELMRVHSSNISLFLKKCHQYGAMILNSEMKLKMNRTRFEFNNYRYPLAIVCFEDATKLGYFEASTLTIGLNRKLIYKAKESTLKDIIRHELGHYYCFIKYGDSINHHGKEYHFECERFGWSKKVSAAKLDIEQEYLSIEGEIQTEAMLEKVKKLLKLASSSNEYESQLATQKANQLLLKYNLNRVTNDETEYFVRPVIHAKKKTALISALYEILPNFLVRPVFSHTKNGISLEVTGSRVNTELAQYVADFLKVELERLYKEHKIHNPHLKGISAKNSYMRGIAKGYVEKVQNNYQDLNDKQSKALISIEHNLDKNLNEIYRGLSSSHSKTKRCLESERAGKKAGKGLSINPGIKSKLKKFLLS